VVCLSCSPGPAHAGGTARQLLHVAEDRCAPSVCGTAQRPGPALERRWWRSGRLSTRRQESQRRRSPALPRSPPSMSARSMPSSGPSSSIRLARRPSCWNSPATRCRSWMRRPGRTALSRPASRAPRFDRRSRPHRRRCGRGSRPPGTRVAAVSTAELVQKSSTTREGQKDEMPDVAAGNRSDEEHPGERLERVAVPSDEYRHADGGPDRPADDPQGIDQPRQARPRRAPAILGRRRDLFMGGLADYWRDRSSDRRGGIEIETTAPTEAERTHSSRVARRADRREHRDLVVQRLGRAYSVPRGGAERRGP
jgi:hypothetical protein